MLAASTLVAHPCHRRYLGGRRVAQGYFSATILRAHGVRRSHLVTLLQDDESLQIGLASRDRFLIPFKANARHVRNVKQPVTNFIGLL